jgi:hypothetical protein
MVRTDLLAVAPNLARLHFGLAAMRVEQDAFGGNIHGDGSVNFFDEIIDDGDRRFP